MNSSSNLVSQPNTQTPETQPVPANQPPIAIQSSLTIQEDSQLTNSELLELFNDPESDNLEIMAISASNGSIQSQAGNFVFNPEPNYSGEVLLSLTVSDGTNTADTDILVNITPLNDQPNAVEDSATLGGNAQSLLIDALANDSDIEDQALSIVSAIAVAGTASIEDGQIRYQREPGYEGEDLIEYTIADTEGSTARGQITVQVDRATTRTVFLQWSAPTERENGETLNADEISGYEIHYRLAHESLDETVVVEGDDSNTRINLVLEGEYEFRIAAIDTDGLYSDFSEPVNVGVYF